MSRRGDLVTVALSGDFGNPRPALVIQSDQFDETATVTMLLISPALVSAPLMRLTVEPSDDNRLERTSQVMIDKVMTVRRDKTGPAFGRVNDAVMLSVNRLMALFFGLGWVRSAQGSDRRRAAEQVEIRPGQDKGCQRAEDDQQLALTRTRLLRFGRFRRLLEFDDVRQHALHLRDSCIIAEAGFQSHDEPHAARGDCTLELRLTPSPSRRTCDGDGNDGREPFCLPRGVHFAPLLLANLSGGTVRGCSLSQQRHVHRRFRGFARPERGFSS